MPNSHAEFPYSREEILWEATAVQAYRGYLLKQFYSNYLESTLSFPFSIILLPPSHFLPQIYVWSLKKVRILIATEKLFIWVDSD
jgi:hypothetical protein